MPTLERSGVRLYFADSGSGLPVLFHTGGGGDGRMWVRAGYLSQLAGARHILMDHRGHGQSDCPAELEAHRIDEYVADVVAVLDAAEVDRAVLVGYSAGADVVLRVAANCPDRCTGVVALGDPPQAIDVSEWNRALAQQVRELGMRAIVEQMSASEPEPAPAWLIDNLAQTSGEMFALMLAAWADAPLLWDCLPRVTAPTLMVVGELEQGGGGAVEAAVSRLRSGRAVVSPRFGHLQNFWHGEVTGPVIAAFLDATR